MKTTAFSHTGNIGDIWSSFGSMRKYCEVTKKKIDLYLVKDVSAKYYEGAVHPTKNDEGKDVMLNDRVLKMMKPLLLAQPFINDVIIITEEQYQTTDILVHLEWIRENPVGMPSFPIQKWYQTIFPDLDFDLSEIWMEVPDSEKDLANGKILVTRSERYTQPGIDYSFLKPYEDDMLFCGTMREYNNFTMSYDLNVRKLNTETFLELAQAIKQCKFHISNQTQAFQMSEGMKTPRILEACTYAPNCIPIGKDAHYFLNQYGLECFFHKLNGTMTAKEVGEKFLAEGEKKRIEMDAKMGIEKPLQNEAAK